MIAEFSIVPLGQGASLGDRIAGLIDIVDRSGLPYKLTPMGTVIEGEWDQVMDLIRKCHMEAMKGSPRVLTRISVDDNPAKRDLMNEKIKSVESRLGRELRK